MVRLVVTNRRFTRYADRRLQVGDVVDVSPKDARLFKAIKYGEDATAADEATAEEAPAPAAVEPTPAPAPANPVREDAPQAPERRTRNRRLKTDE